MRFDTNFSQKQNPSFQLRLDKQLKISVIRAAQNDGQLNTAEKLIKEVESYGDTNSFISMVKSGGIVIKNSKLKDETNFLAKNMLEFSNNPLTFLKTLTEDVIDAGEYYLFTAFATGKGLKDKPKAALNLLHHKIDNKTFLKFKEYITSGIPPYSPSKGFEARQNELINKLAK